MRIRIITTFVRTSVFNILYTDSILFSSSEPCSFFQKAGGNRLKVTLELPANGVKNCGQFPFAWIKSPIISLCYGDTFSWKTHMLQISVLTSFSNYFFRCNSQPTVGKGAGGCMVVLSMHNGLCQSQRWERESGDLVLSRENVLFSLTQIVIITLLGQH